MARFTTERSALGRDARIGDLYDANAECFTGSSILKKDPPATSVHITNKHSSDSQYLFYYTFPDKCEKLNVGGELQISLLAGLVQLEGSGKYLQDEKYSARAVRSSLIYTVQTQVEHINLFSEELKDCFVLDTLYSSQATHVAVEIRWGVKTIVTLEDANEHNHDNIKIKRAMQAEMNLLTGIVEETADVQNIKLDGSNRNSFSTHTFSDLLSAGELLQTYESTLEVMKKMRAYLNVSNEDKGKPLSFLLLPLSGLKKHLNLDTAGDIIYKMISYYSGMRFVKLFEGFSEVKQHFYDLHEDMKRHDTCITKGDLESVEKHFNQVNEIKAELKSKFAKLLISVRSGLADIKVLEALRNEFEAKPLSLQHFAHEMNKYSTAKEKMTFVDMITKAGVVFVGIGTSLETLIMKYRNNDIYILFYSESKKQTDPRWRDHVNTILRLAEKSSDSADEWSTHPNRHVIAVDTDIRPELKLDSNEDNSLCLCLYRNGRYVDKDVVKSDKEQQLSGYAVCKKNLTTLRYPPNKTVVLMVCCPNSLYGSCPSTKIAWHCKKCNDLIEYGFDNYFYCKCNGNARGPVSQYQFRCNNHKHGPQFRTFERKILEKTLKEHQPLEECINILILGETGVGKSTWINGIANYMSFSSLEEAKENEPMSLIGASFTVMDDNFEEKVVRIGDSSNEDLKIGQSATQDPKAYIFHWNDRMVRLIDTPGIGDTRGIQQDKANFDAILQFLSRFKELHGVCILLKPNNARLGVMFKFCIKELLTHLHRSCSQNIVFCFTNARNTFYKPGDTFPALKKLLLENKDVTITLSNDTIYCMDNESFRFLSMIHNGIPTKEEEFLLYSTSWDRSVSETNRLLKYISNMKPHVIQDTLSLNDTRRIIVSMTKPIADISKNIQANIAVIEDKKQEILCSKASMESLQTSLYMPGINLVAVPLNYPKTVCTSSGCVRYHTVKDVNITNIEYFTICHSRCYLQGVTPESFPNAELQHCAAMTGGNSTCGVCGCSWDKHMHITYDQIIETCEVLDNSVDAQIKSKQTNKEKVESFIQKMVVRMESLQGEQKIIRSACAKFGTFLANNAMLPYNDALADYLEMLIKQEKDKCTTGGDKKTLEGLEQMLQEYLEEVNTLKESILNGGNAQALSTVEINRTIEELYKLPIKGAELKQHMHVATATRSRMFSFNQTHYRPPQKSQKQIQRTSNSFQGIWRSFVSTIYDKF